MRKAKDTASRVRLANAIAAAVLAVAFLGHALLGSLAHLEPLPAPPMALLWVLVGVACAHAALSVATTVFMRRDTERPPSVRKKRHQLLKWVSGAVLAAATALHVTQVPLFGLSQGATALVLLAAFAWHGWAGMKSLSRDLGASSALKKPLRAVLCAGVGACVAMMAAAVL